MSHCGCTSKMDAGKILDVRTIPCSTKHGLILQRWMDLPVNDHFVLINGHDPVPLYYQFDAEYPGAFRWEHLANEPENVQIKITKLRDVAADRTKQWTCPSADESH
jgi:uncharacterized protein (DUF2249 family)